MANLDWSQCLAVESLPGKRSGAVVFRATRTPVSAVFENLQVMSVDRLIQEYLERIGSPSMHRYSSSHLTPLMGSDLRVRLRFLAVVVLP